MASIGSNSRMPARLLALAGGFIVTALVLLTVYAALAAPPGNEHFQRTWERTDRPVLDGVTARTWMWGPEANTGLLQEPYAEAPGGQRDVQYYDKARMEITDPAADQNSIWYVTNGLLVVELITGNMQIGNAAFEQRQPAQVNVAGDFDDPTGVTYAALSGLLDASPAAPGATITQRVNREGIVSDDPGLAAQGVTAAIVDEVTNHAIAGPFWQFMTSSGTVYVEGQFIDSPLFENPYFATGRPIAEPYWANVKVAGTYRDVLLQCFERRCLTYTPGNPEGFVVEAGNVGQHYYAWRYGGQPGEATPTPTATASPTPTSTASPTPTEEPVTDYEFAGQWGKAYTPEPELDRPRDIALDADGNLWIVDFDTDQLLQFDAQGRFLRVVGSTGSGDGQFNNPAGVAIAADGRIYVADQSNSRIQVFDAEGNFLSKWGEPGAGDGQFFNPNGVAILGDRVYVSEVGSHRVQIFNLEGAFQGKFGSKGTGDGEFEGPNYMTFDAQGNLLISDFYNGRVQKFTSAGAYLSQFGTEGSATGQLNGPSGLAIDSEGNIYVADFYNNRIQKFDPAGNYLTQWGGEGTGFGQLRDPIGLVLDGSGDLFVADAGNNRIQKLAAEGGFLFEFYDTSRGTFGTLLDIDVDQNGNLLTIDVHKELYESGSVSRFTPDGIPLDVLGRTRPGIGQYDILSGIAVNLENGDIYLTDRITNRVQRFTSTWQYRGTWGMTGTVPGQLSGPTAIAIDGDGNVYVADTGNNRIQKFDANGVFLDQWGGVGDGDGQFQQPSGIIVDGERVYVSDSGNDRVQVFDRAGNYLSQWGSTGIGTGQLDGPVGIAVNPDGNVLVVDSINNRVQIFSPDGEPLGAFGSLGSEPGEFNLPYGITVDAGGFAYVIDILNDRVQKFAPVS